MRKVFKRHAIMDSSLFILEEMYAKLRLVQKEEESHLKSNYNCVELFGFLVSQITSEVFFIDWERPRGVIVSRSDDSTFNPVTIWRTYIVANEWNELQTYRRISCFFQLFVVCVLLKVNAVIEPGFRTTAPAASAVDSVITFLVERCFWDQIRNFVDLCSISNISVLGLQNHLYGFYLHGRSVHGYADCDIKEMNDKLQREKACFCFRGLEPNSEVQSFTVYLSDRFRLQYDRISRLITNGLDLKECFTFVDGRKLKLLILLDYSEQAFTKLFFFGNEFTLFTFEMSLFCYVEYLSRNVVLAAAVTAFVVMIVKKLREKGGIKNLTRTSLVDARFLL
ncbi:unnamed protein product [Soboliphyme baturini]|uniref:Meckelin n=1 Tax=Soboliphyme baturini TaxID=241478 RepID=A0A183J7S4_9BILA|nr:unnamed protein product [Soboliphyme baturini]